MGGTSYNGHAAVVRELLSAGAAVNASTVTGNAALHLASKNGHAEVVRELLAAGATVGLACVSDGKTALHLAALHSAGDSNRGEAVLRELLARAEAATVALRDHSGRTALDIAASRFSFPYPSPFVALLRGPVVGA